MLFVRPQAITAKMAQTKVTCHGAGLVAGDADFKNSFTVFVEKGKIGGISVAFEGKRDQLYLILLFEHPKLLELRRGFYQSQTHILVHT